MMIRTNSVMVRVNRKVYASIGSLGVDHGHKVELASSHLIYVYWSRIDKIFSNDN